MRGVGSRPFEGIRESPWGAFEVKTSATRKLVCHGQWAKVCSGDTVKAKPLRQAAGVAGLVSLGVAVEGHRRPPS